MYFLVRFDYSLSDHFYIWFLLDENLLICADNNIISVSLDFQPNTVCSFICCILLFRLWLDIFTYLKIKVNFCIKNLQRLRIIQYLNGKCIWNHLQRFDNYIYTPFHLLTLINMFEDD